jgi:hypothetical protein
MVLDLLLRIIEKIFSFIQLNVQVDLGNLWIFIIKEKVEIKI